MHEERSRGLQGRRQQSTLNISVFFTAMKIQAKAPQGTRLGNSCTSRAFAFSGHTKSYQKVSTATYLSRELDLMQCNMPISL